MTTWWKFRSILRCNILSFSPFFFLSPSLSVALPLSHSLTPYPSLSSLPFSLLPSALFYARNPFHSASLTIFFFTFSSCYDVVLRNDNSFGVNNDIKISLLLKPIDFACSGHKSSNDIVPFHFMSVCIHTCVYVMCAIASHIFDFIFDSSGYKTT